MSYLETVQKIINNQGKSGFMVMHVKIELLADYIRGGKGKIGSVIYDYVFILYSILDKVSQPNIFDTIMSEDGLGIWINHTTFCKKVKHKDLTPRALIAYLAALKNDFKLINSKMIHTKGEHPKCYYFITRKGLEFMSKHMLEKYAKILNKYMNEE